MISPLRARSSTGSWFQRVRRVPVNFSFPMVCRAPLREKKLVSPEKNAPLTGSGSSAAGSAGGEKEGAAKAGAAAAGCASGQAGCETGVLCERGAVCEAGAVCEIGALHQASVVAPALAAISAVSVAAPASAVSAAAEDSVVSASSSTAGWAGSLQAGFSLAAGAGWRQCGTSAGAGGSHAGSAGSTFGSGHAGWALAELCSVSTAFDSGALGSLGMYFSTVFSNRSEVNGLFNDPMTLALLIWSSLRS